MTFEPAHVLDDVHFPEALRWHQGRLWFSDMLGGTVYSFGEGQLRTEAEVDAPGGLGWLPTGELLVVSMNERRLVRVDHDGNVETHADLSALIRYPANDLYVDATGRAYVGSYGHDADGGAPVEPVQLVVVDVKGNAILSGEPLVFPNGIVPRGDAELVIAETFADRVSTVAVDATGALGERRMLASFSAGDGPDGICVDADGGVWVSCAYGEKLVHLTSAGDVDVAAAIPGRGVLCCVLGGQDLQTLYVAVAPTDEEYAARHRDGSILAIDLQVRNR